MFGVAAELENVPLHYAHVLQQHPGRVQKSCRLGAAQLRGNTAHHLLKLGMRPSPGKQLEQMPAKFSVVASIFRLDYFRGVVHLSLALLEDEEVRWLSFLGARRGRRGKSRAPVGAAAALLDHRRRSRRPCDGGDSTSA